MSLELMQAVATNSRAGDLDRTVLALMAFYARRGTNLTWVTAPTLERDFGISQRRVYQARVALQRLGELQRRSELERPDRRRVYEVIPGAERQLALNVDDALPAPDVHTNGAACTDEGGYLHLRARVEGTEERTVNDNPPNPPKGGTGADSESGTGTTPRVDPQRSTAGWRRRARRRRPRTQRIAPRAPSPCPLEGESTDSEAFTELHDIWQRLLAQISQRIGQDNCEIWLSGVHLHHAGPTLELGLPTDYHTWVQKRYGPLLEEIAGKPIRYVLCAGTGQRNAEKATR